VAAAPERQLAGALREHLGADVGARRARGGVREACEDVELREGLPNPLPHADVRRSDLAHLR
jgi:hypothetical protein